MSKTTNKFLPHVRKCAVWMVSEHRADHRSGWNVMVSIAGKIGCTAETLRRWRRHLALDHNDQMQIIPIGPSIPDELLVARDAGDAIFF